MNKEVPEENKQQNHIQRDKKEKSKDEIIQPDVLDKLPSDVKEIVELSIQSFSGRLPSPIAQKITQEHIGKIIDHNEKG